MKPKALIISLKIDWDNESVTDSMMTFIDGDNPIDNAHHTIEAIESDFPNYRHIVTPNDAALLAQLAAIKPQLMKTGER